VDVEGGTVTISQSEIEFNSAFGGEVGVKYIGSGTQIASGVAGGGAAGGGIYVEGGKVHLTLDVIQGNGANGVFGTGGSGPQSHNASGGGLYVVTGTTVTEDSYTLGNLLYNADSNFDGNDNLGTGGPIG
jgi:hypothetical protein